MQNSIIDYINKFRQYLKTEQKCSAKTLQNYSFYLDRFCSWYGPSKKASGINIKAISQYRIWLSRLSDVHGIPLKKNTQNYHLIALRSFFKYLNNKGVKTIYPSNIPLTKTNPIKIVNLSDGELSRLLEEPLTHINTKTYKHINNTTGEIIKQRDKAILETLYSTGLRVSELIRLKKISKLKLSNQARYWLNVYLKTRQDTNPYLFISYDLYKDAKEPTFAKATVGKQENIRTNNYQPLTTRSVQRIVQKYAKLAGIKTPVTPHTLRHSHRVSQSETD